MSFDEYDYVLEEGYREMGEKETTLEAFIIEHPEMRRFFNSWDCEGRSEKSLSFRVGMKAKPFAYVSANGNLFIPSNRLCISGDNLIC